MEKKKEKSYQIELSENEVLTLHGILMSVGGHTKQSPRKYADNINMKLSSIIGEITWQKGFTPRGSVYFDDSYEDYTK